MRTAMIAVILMLCLSAGVSLAGPLCETLVRHPELDAEIGITAEQREEMEKIFETTEKEIIESRSRMQVKRLEMERLMRSEAPDIREIRKLVNEIGDAKSSSMMAGIERKLKMRKVLSRDQMDKAKRLVRMDKARMDRRGERGFGRVERWMRDLDMPGMQGSGRHEQMMKGTKGQGMQHPGCHKQMMKGTEGQGMQHPGCHKQMMKGTEGEGMQHPGCHKHMMKGTEGEGMQHPGCHKQMMKGAEDPEGSPSATQESEDQ
jgi:hypothetical protein